MPPPHKRPRLAPPSLPGSTSAPAIAPSIHQRFPNEIMDMIIEYIAAGLRIRPKLNATQADLSQAGLAFLFVNKALSGSFKRFMKEHVKISLPTDLHIVELLQSPRARLQDIKHIILPGRMSTARLDLWSYSPTPLLLKMLFAGLSNIRRVELVDNTGAWKNKHRPFNRSVFENTTSDSVIKMLLRHMAGTRSNPDSTVSPLVCIYDLIHRCRTAVGMPCSSLLLTFEPGILGSANPGPSELASSAGATATRRLADYDRSSKHWLLSWSAVGERPKLRLEVNGSQDTLRNALAAQTFLFRQQDPAYGLDYALGLLQSVFLRDPTSEEVVCMCRALVVQGGVINTPQSYKVTVLRLYSVLAASRLPANADLGKYELYRFTEHWWSNKGAMFFDRKWEEKYDQVGLDAWEKFKFFMEVFGYNVPGKHRVM